MVWRPLLAGRKRLPASRPWLCSPRSCWRRAVRHPARHTRLLDQQTGARAVGRHDTNRPGRSVGADERVIVAAPDFTNGEAAEGAAWVFHGSATGLSATADWSAEANQALDDALARPDVGIILVTEDVAALVEARMDQLKMHSTVPLVVEIPAPEEVRVGKPSLSEVVKRAIGIKI